MAILKSENKNTDFLMILAPLCRLTPSKVNEQNKQRAADIINALSVEEFYNILYN